MDLEESIDARYEMDPLNINTTAPSSLLTSFSGQGTQSNHLPFHRSPRNGYAASSETCQIIDSVSVPHLKYESFKDIQIKKYSVTCSLFCRIYLKCL